MSKPLNAMRSHASILPTPKRGTDTFTLTVPDAEVFHSSRLTLHESQPDSGAKIKTQPPGGAKGAQEISVEWWHNGGTNLRYQLEGFTQAAQTAPNPASVTKQSTGFVPSKHGFHFINLFPNYPDLTLPTPLGKIQIGNAANGLCGGMAFAALDFYHAGKPVPDTTTPPAGDIFFDFLVKRLFDSFNLPLGIGGYIALMNPYLPDGESDASKHGVAPHGRAWQTIRQEWPVIKTILDAGQPCPLGLVRVVSPDIRKLGLNHQVLTYGYDLVGDDLTLFIYDPNYRDKDDVSISLNLAAPELPTKMTYSTGEALFAFFHVDYKFVMPFSDVASNGRIIIFEQPNFGGNMKDILIGSANLALFENGSFNKQISSFIIVNGNWMFFKNSGFDGPYLQDGKPLVLGPGRYAQLESAGIPDNDISSLKAVDLPGPAPVIHAQ